MADDRLSAHDLFRALLESQGEVRKTNEKVADVIGAHTGAIASNTSKLEAMDKKIDAAVIAINAKIDSTSGTREKVFIGLIIFLVIACGALVGVKIAAPGVSEAPTKTEMMHVEELSTDAGAIEASLVPD